MDTGIYKSFKPERWNACLELLCRPIEGLNGIQRLAALVFHYDGCVQNGGHSSHFDFDERPCDDELLQALRTIGANEQARMFTEACLLKRMTDEADEGECESLWETMAEVDRQYYKSLPDIPELLARYFDAHREDFPK